MACFLHVLWAILLDSLTQIFRNFRFPTDFLDILGESSTKTALSSLVICARLLVDRWIVKACGHRCFFLIQKSPLLPSESDCLSELVVVDSKKNPTAGLPGQRLESPFLRVKRTDVVDFC